MEAAVHSPEFTALVNTITRLLSLFGGGVVIAMGLGALLARLWIARQLQSERAELDRRLATHTLSLNQTLEAYRLSLNASLAAYTSRTGPLAELQLRTCQTIWARLFKIQWDAIRRASPLQSVSLEPGVDFREALERQTREQLQALDRDRIALLEAVHEGRPFLPLDLFQHLDQYCARLGDLIMLLDEHAEEERVRPVGETPEEGIQRRRAYRERRDALIRQLDDLHNQVADEIRGLTNPALPAPPPPSV